MLSVSLSPWANHLLNVVVIRPPSNLYLQRLCSHLGHSGSLWPTGARIRLNCLRRRRKNPGLREFNVCQSPSNHSKRLGERGTEPVVKNRRTRHSGLRRLHLLREGASGLLGFFIHWKLACPWASYSCSVETHQGTFVLWVLSHLTML